MAGGLTMQHFCSQNIMRLGEAARWPGNNPRLPWNVDLSGYQGSMTPANLIEAFRLAWLWWAEAAEINPIMVGTAAEALIRKHFKRIDGPSGVLAWSELADNTNQPKTQRYDSGDNWNLQFLATVACHEIGHVLGLEHDSQTSKTLMAPFIQDDVPKPTPRDIQRLLSLGYAKRVTPLPGPDDTVVGFQKVRITKALAAGVYGDFTLGSAMGVGDYLLLPSEPGFPPVVP